IECILVTAEENKIRLTANNMELAIETILEGEIKETGVVALEAKLFLDSIRLLYESDVTISTDDNFLTTIQCEGDEYKISGKSGDDFPELPAVEKNDPLKISCLTFKDIVRQTIFSVSENESNKMMAGELLEVKNNVLSMISLDGHRISIRKTPLKEENSEENEEADAEAANEHRDVSVVVPGKNLDEVSRIIPGEINKDIKLFFTDKHIIFEFENTTVVSRIIEGEYYRVDQMLSNDYETKLKINKKKFLDSVDKATVIVKEGDKKPIIISIEDQSMNIKINSPVASFHGDLEVEKEGQDIMIGFNPKFIKDVLRVVDDETITVYMVNPKAPCTIKNEDESYIYLVLPVNFKTVD
ncbi:MAG: DNA polymerase III subunit beta, partial [Lachnospiraceae bacterium]|nr:DNA polymerase III subunit beta [Lachnospiraceae bacterium]